MRPRFSKTLAFYICMVIFANVVALSVWWITRIPTSTAHWVTDQLQVSSANRSFLGRRLGEILTSSSTEASTSKFRHFGQVPGSILVRQSNGRVEEVNVSFSDYAGDDELFKSVYFDKQSVDEMYSEIRQSLSLKLGEGTDASMSDELGYPSQSSRWMLDGAEVVLKKQESNDNCRVCLCVRATTR